MRYTSIQNYPVLNILETNKFKWANKKRVSKIRKKDVDKRFDHFKINGSKKMKSAVFK